jgi:hypothetical protein
MTGGFWSWFFSEEKTQKEAYDKLVKSKDTKKEEK